jgi:hypothetical protein
MSDRFDLRHNRDFHRATVSLREPVDVGTTTETDRLGNAMVCVEPGWVIVDQTYSTTGAGLVFIPSEQVRSVVFEGQEPENSP